MFWNLFKRKKGEEEIITLKSMQKLDIKDGDIIILSCSQKLSVDMANHLKRKVEEFMKTNGYGIKVMILDEEIQIGVLRKDHPPEKEA